MKRSYTIRFYFGPQKKIPILLSPAIDHTKENSLNKCTFMTIYSTYRIQLFVMQIYKWVIWVRDVFIILKA